MKRRGFLRAGATAAAAWPLRRSLAAAASPGIKKGISIWAFPQGKPVKEAVSVAREAGFAGIELAFAEQGELTMRTTAEEARALAAETRAAGLEVTSLATTLLWQKTLSSEDEAVRAEAQAIVRKMLELAQALGVDTILIVPGLVGRGLSADMVSGYETVWRRSQAALRPLLAEAARRKVVIGVENVWNRFLLSPLEMRRYLEELRSPWIKAYLDVGNVLRFGYPQDWVRTLGPLIQRVHVKDYKVAENTFVGLLQGDMPWKAIVAAFREVGYRGWWTAEVSPGRAVPEAIVAETVAGDGSDPGALITHRESPFSRRNGARRPLSFRGMLRGCRRFW
jgi:hexulose-6-phosphate isomerase